MKWSRLSNDLWFPTELQPKIVYFIENVHGFNGRRYDITCSLRKCYLRVVIIYSYVIPVWSIVKMITSWWYGRTDALLRKAKGWGQ